MSAFKDTEIEELLKAVKEGTCMEGSNIEYKLCKSKLSRDLWDIYGTLLGHIKGVSEAYKPQINADERRYLPVTYFIKTTHCKEMQHESLRSLRLNVFSAPAPERAPPHPVPAHLLTSRAGG